VEVKGNRAKVSLANMVRGLTLVNPQSLEPMRVLSASRAEVFWKLRLSSSFAEPPA
jgi:NitT/TauT family transport system permease protein